MSRKNLQKINGKINVNKKSVSGGTERHNRGNVVVAARVVWPCAVATCDQCLLDVGHASFMPFVVPGIDDNGSYAVGGGVVFFFFAQ